MILKSCHSSLRVSGCSPRSSPIHQTSLTTTTSICRYGVYVLFPTGSLLGRPAVGCEAYGDGSQDPAQHDLQTLIDPWALGCHSQVHTVTNLLGDYRGSRLYINSCRGGVDLNPRRFTTFDTPLPASYDFILEAIGQIIFGTYQDQGYYHSWSTPASYALTNKIRESLRLAAVTWKGCSSAWTVFQGVPYMRKKFETACGNLSCTMIAKDDD